MSEEAKPLSAKEETLYRYQAAAGTSFTTQQVKLIFATLDAERAKVEALEGLNAAAAADGLSKIADHWRARATAAEAEAERMLGLISQARAHGWLSWMSDGRRAADVADEFLARAALAKEKPDAGE